jgi:hypothetical protein
MKIRGEYNPILIIVKQTVKKLRNRKNAEMVLAHTSSYCRALMNDKKPQPTGWG